MAPVSLLMFVICLSLSPPNLTGGFSILLIFSMAQLWCELYSSLISCFQLYCFLFSPPFLAAFTPYGSSQSRNGIWSTSVTSATAAVSWILNSLCQARDRTGNHQIINPLHHSENSSVIVISALICIYSFLPLTVNLICSSFSSFLRWNQIIDFRSFFVSNMYSHINFPPYIACAAATKFNEFYFHFHLIQNI